MSKKCPTCEREIREDPVGIQLFGENVLAASLAIWIATGIGAIVVSVPAYAWEFYEAAAWLRTVGGACIYSMVLGAGVVTVLTPIAAWKERRAEAVASATKTLERWDS